MQINFAKAFLLGIWPLFLVLSIIVIIKYILHILEKQKLSKSGISAIDKMDGRTFEKYLKSLFVRLGYKVDRTKYIGDYGAECGHP